MAVFTASGGGKSQHYTASITAAWTGSVAPFTQNVTVTGITANDKPIIDLDLSSVAVGDVEQKLEDWSQVYRAVTGTNVITFYSLVKTVVLPIKIKVI